MSVADYCRRNPLTAGPDTLLREAARRMADGSVGCLVVVDGESRPLGVVSDRDVALAVLHRGVNPDETPVGELLHGSVVSITENGALTVAIRRMRLERVRRIPVVQPRTGVLTGILALDDVLQLLASELSGAARTIRAQFPLESGAAPASAGG